MKKNQRIIFKTDGSNPIICNKKDYKRILYALHIADLLYPEEIKNLEK